MLLITFIAYIDDSWCTSTTQGHNRFIFFPYNSRSHHRFLIRKQSVNLLERNITARWDKFKTLLPNRKYFIITQVVRLYLKHI